jgi:gas vesicle protein
MTDTRTDPTAASLDESARVRSEIDDTREHLGQTVEAIGDRVIPGRIIERRKESTSQSLRGLRDRVMGRAQHTRDHVADSAGSTVDHLRDAPDSIAQRAEGSLLAAGGVAFAIGLLAAAVWRPTEPERQAIEKVAEAAPQITSGVTEVGREVADTVKHEAASAAEELKSSVAEAGGAVKAAASPNP